MYCEYLRALCPPSAIVPNKSELFKKTKIHVHSLLKIRWSTPRIVADGMAGSADDGDWFWLFAARHLLPLHKTQTDNARLTEIRMLESGKEQVREKRFRLERLAVETLVDGRDLTLIKFLGAGGALAEAETIG